MCIRDREGNAWSGRLNLSSLSLFSFSELNKAIDTNEYNSWRVLIFHNSTRTTNSVRLILGSQYSISANPILSHVQLCENHIKQARLLWGLKQVLGSNVIPLRTPENQIWHTDDICLSQKNKAIFFICRSSSAIAQMTQVTQVLAIRASCFYFPAQS